MRIGFFGGTFDPPHNGHLAVARAAVDAFALDRLLLAPVAAQPLKPGGAIAPYNDRLRMVELLTAGKPSLEASALDAALPGDTPNYTIDTLTRLRATLQPTDQLFVLTGIDAFGDLPRWKSPEALLHIADWIVVTRPGPDELDAAQPILDRIVPAARRPHIHLLDTVHNPTSASEIRRRLAHHEPCDTMLPAEVLHYIQQHHLYPSNSLPNATR